MSASKEISSILVQIIKSKSNKNISKKLFDKDLYKQGIVDSFDILKLITEFENKFSIRTKNKLRISQKKYTRTVKE